MLRFGEKTVKAIYFYSGVTAYCIEDVNIENLVVSDSIPANKGKEERIHW